MLLFCQSLLCLILLCLFAVVTQSMATKERSRKWSLLMFLLSVLIALLIFAICNKLALDWVRYLKKLIDAVPFTF